MVSRSRVKSAKQVEGNLDCELGIRNCGCTMQQHVSRVSIQDFIVLALGYGYGGLITIFK